MSKLDDLIVKCEAQLKATGVKASSDLLRAVTKGLGPSVYNRDGLLVAARDKSELDRIKNNFIAKKLGEKDDAKADAAIEYAIDKIGPSNRNKMRPVFYTLIVKKLGKESLYS